MTEKEVIVNQVELVKRQTRPYRLALNQDYISRNDSSLKQTVCRVKSCLYSLKRAKNKKNGE